MHDKIFESDADADADADSDTDTNNMHLQTTQEKHQAFMADVRRLGELAQIEYEKQLEANKILTSASRSTCQLSNKQPDLEVSQVDNLPACTKAKLTCKHSVYFI